MKSKNRTNIDKNKLSRSLPWINITAVILTFEKYILNVWINRKTDFQSWLKDVYVCERKRFFFTINCGQKCSVFVKHIFPYHFNWFYIHIFSDNRTCIRLFLALSQYWLTRIHTSIHPCLKTVWQQTFHAQWPVVPGFIRCTFHFSFSLFFSLSVLLSLSLSLGKSFDFVVCSLQPHIKFPFDRQRLIAHMKSVNVHFPHFGHMFQLWTVEPV